MENDGEIKENRGKLVGIKGRINGYKGGCIMNKWKYAGNKSEKWGHKAGNIAKTGANKENYGMFNGNKKGGLKNRYR